MSSYDDDISDEDEKLGFPSVSSLVSGALHSVANRVSGRNRGSQLGSQSSSPHHSPHQSISSTGSAILTLHAPDVPLSSSTSFVLPDSSAMTPAAPSMAALSGLSAASSTSSTGTQQGSQSGSIGGRHHQTLSAASKSSRSVRIHGSPLGRAPSHFTESNVGSSSYFGTLAPVALHSLHRRPPATPAAATSSPFGFSTRSSQQSTAFTPSHPIPEYNAPDNVRHWKRYSYLPWQDSNRNSNEGRPSTASTVSINPVNRTDATHASSLAAMATPSHLFNPVEGNERVASILASPFMAGVIAGSAPPAGSVSSQQFNAVADLIRGLHNNYSVLANNYRRLNPTDFDFNILPPIPADQIAPLRPIQPADPGPSIDNRAHEHAAMQLVFGELDEDGNPVQTEQQRVRTAADANRPQAQPQRQQDQSQPQFPLQAQQPQQRPTGREGFDPPPPPDPDDDDDDDDDEGPYGGFFDNNNRPRRRQPAGGVVRGGQLVHIDDLPQPNVPIAYKAPVLGMMLPCELKPPVPKLTKHDTVSYVFFKRAFVAWLKLHGISTLLDHPSEVIVQMAIEYDDQYRVNRSPRMVKQIIEIQLGKIRGALEQSLGNNTATFVNAMMPHPSQRNYPTELHVDASKDAFGLMTAIEGTFVQSNAFEANRAMERLQSLTYKSNDHPMVLMNSLIDIINLLQATDAWSLMPTSAIDQIKVQAMLKALPKDLSYAKDNLMLLKDLTPVMIYESLVRIYQSKHEPGLESSVKGDEGRNFSGGISEDPKPRANNSDMECEHCGIKGHNSSMCFKLHPEKRPKDYGRDRRNDKSNAAKVGNKPVVCMINAIQHGGHLFPNRYTYTIDSATCAHISSFKENLGELKSLSEPIVLQFPNGTKYRVTHFGSMKINANLTLSAVLYVPGGEINLVCLAKILDNKQLRVELDAEKLTVKMRRGGANVIEFTRRPESMLWEYVHDSLNSVDLQIGINDKTSGHVPTIKKKSRSDKKKAKKARGRRAHFEDEAPEEEPAPDEAEDGEIQDDDDNAIDKEIAERHKKAEENKRAAQAHAPPAASANFVTFNGSQYRKVSCVKLAPLIIVPPPLLHPNLQSSFHPVVPSSHASLNHVSSIVIQEKPSLFHQRFGHPAIKKMKQLNELYNLGMSNEEIQHDYDIHCQPCIDGKLKAKAIHKKWNQQGIMEPAKNIWDRLHADLIGPFTSTNKEGRIVRNYSPNRALYVLVIVDEASGFVFSFPLRHKDEAHKHIETLFVAIKNRWNVGVKEFHSDGGGEFVNDDMAQTCRQFGIKQTWTTANKPQHNGIAERHNGILLSLMRVFLHQAGADKSLYQEAFSHAMMVHNQTPREYFSRAEQDEDDSKSVKTISSPFRLINSNPGPVDRIRVWGCDAFVLVPRSARGKTDKLAVPGIYMTPSDVQNCHRILMPATMSIIHTRDVTFNEQSFEQVRSLQFRFKQTIYEQSPIVDPQCHFIPPGDFVVPANEDFESDSDDEIEQPQLDEFPISALPSNAPTRPTPVIVEMPRVADNESPVVIDVSEWVDDEENDASIDPGSNADDVDEPIESDEDSGAPVSAPVPDEASASSRPRRNASQPQRYTFPRRIKGKALAGPVYAVNMLDHFEPSSYKQAITCKESKAWLYAIAKEVDQVVVKQVFVPCCAPKGRKLLSSRWVFRIKIGADGQVADHKARVVVRGFEQVPGLDFGDDITASVVRADSIRVLLILCAVFDMELEQLDFKSAFLNAEMDEDVFILPPQGFEHLISTAGHNAFRLNKSLYGLKQAPLRWYETAVELFVSLGYIVGVIDKCVFYKHFFIALDGKQERATIMLSLYVDDTLVVFNNLARSTWELDKAAIAATFDIKDLGEAKWILNMLITRNREARTVSLSQEVYVKSIVERFGLSESNPCPTPCIVDRLTPQEIKHDEVLVAAGKKYYQSMVGSLMYAAVTTRPDISYAVNMLARNNAEPHNHHITRAKRVFRYLHGTSNKLLVFGDNATNTPVISAFSDADWAGDADRKSITGNILCLYGSPVSWQSKKQTTVAQSSCEAEYVAIASMCNQVVWLQHWLQDVLGVEVSGIPLYTDSTAAIGVASNLGSHMRVKHIDVKIHLVREHVRNDVIKLIHLSSAEMPADLLTKPLSHELFNKFTHQLLK